MSYRFLGDDANKLKEEGNKYFAKKDFENAIKSYTKALKIEEHHILYSNRSVSYAYLNKWNEALEDAEAAMKLHPKWPRAYLRKGCALAGLGLYDDAIDTFYEGLSIDENDEQLVRQIERVRILQEKHQKISKKTKAIKAFLNKKLKKEGKKLGVATDLGCCFYDAVAQGLRRMGYIHTTIKSLRMAIHEYILNLEANVNALNRNWVKDLKDKNVNCSVNYEEYKNKVQYTSHEAKMRNDLPIWGDPQVDGKIIATIYGIKIKVYEAGLLDETQKPTEENIYYGDDLVIGDKNLPDSKMIEIALYPGHFVPVEKIL